MIGQRKRRDTEESRDREAKELNVFSFPDAGSELKKSAAIKSDRSAWFKLPETGQGLSEQVSSPGEVVYKAAEFSDISVPMSDGSGVESISKLDKAIAERTVRESSVQEPSLKKPLENASDADPAGVQKVLNETFEKGLEQGRREGRATLAQELQEQAAKKGFSEGEQAGHEQGLQQGLQQAQTDIAHRVAALTGLYDELLQQRRILDHQQIQQAAVLLEKLMLEILRVELKHSPEQIEALVREAIQLLDTTEQESLKIRLNPADSQWLQPFLDAEHYSVRVIEDDLITPGGCRIEGVLGDVDATLETRLQAGVDHLRTLLLDDHEQVGPADLSVVTDELRKERKASFRPISDRFDIPAPALSSSVAPSEKSSELIEPEGSEGASFTFNPVAESSSALGAWDGLGQ